MQENQKMIDPIINELKKITVENGLKEEELSVGYDPYKLHFAVFASEKNADGIDNKDEVHEKMLKQFINIFGKEKVSEVPIGKDKNIIIKADNLIIIRENLNKAGYNVDVAGLEK